MNLVLFVISGIFWGKTYLLWIRDNYFILKITVNEAAITQPENHGVC